MRLPEVVSQLGTTFIGSRAEQSPNWRSNIAYTPQSSLCLCTAKSSVLPLVVALTWAARFRADVPLLAIIGRRQTHWVAVARGPGPSLEGGACRLPTPGTSHPHDAMHLECLTWNRNEWTGWDLNPRPPACKAGDTTADLPARARSGEFHSPYPALCRQITGVPRSSRLGSRDECEIG